jgi:hypothetical protein
MKPMITRGSDKRQLAELSVQAGPDAGLGEGIRVPSACQNEAETTDIELLAGYEQTSPD